MSITITSFILLNKMYQIRIQQERDNRTWKWCNKPYINKVFALEIERTKKKVNKQIESIICAMEIKLYTRNWNNKWNRIEKK